MRDDDIKMSTVTLDNLELSENVVQITAQPNTVGFVGEIEIENDSDVEDPYDTQHLHTYGYDTHEAIPATVFYRDAERNARARPTLADLADHFKEAEEGTGSAPKGQQSTPLTDAGVHVVDTQGESIAASEEKAPLKFGWIKGVLVRVLLNIWGVMLFIRLSWVVGQSGIGLACLIILLSQVVTVITTISMSAICTNGEVKGGGAYYMISRSLGPEFGGAIGLLLTVANMIGIAVYVVGFAETVVSIMLDYGVSMTGTEINDIRIIGVITIVLLFGIALIGTSWESKVQLVLLFLLIVAILGFAIGSFVGPLNDSERNEGFVGYSGSLFMDNFGPDFRGETFFTVFAVFFPAATGILAGANISGDLKDPQVAIPKGTFLGIGLSGIVYWAMAIMVGSCVLREVTYNGTEFGLLNDFGVMSLVSINEWLVNIGIFSATLSSALVSFISAPKILQSVCEDKLFPYISFFATGVGVNNEPRNGYILSFVVGIGFTLIGDLNSISPILSNFFLMSYACINYACFANSLAKTPGWRPWFKYYNMWVSLLGALLCVAIMFVMSWYIALATIIVGLIIYQFIAYRKPNVNWGTASEAMNYIQAIKAVRKYGKTQDHVKNFRPQFLVMGGDLEKRGHLALLCSEIAQKMGMVICGSVVEDKTENGEELDFATILLKCSNEKIAMKTWLTENKVKAFVNSTAAPSLRKGYKQLIMLSGLETIRPNIVVSGFLQNWRNETPERVDEYVGMIQDSFAMKLGAMVIRGTTDPESGQVQIPALIEDSVNGYIDVWWLVDDGGLTLLVPHLINQRKKWQKCKLRVFAVGVSGSIDKDRLRMVQLLRKFRIDSEVVVLDDLKAKPSEESLNKFRVFKTDEPFSDKTLRHIKIKEMMMEYSMDSKLVFLSLPFPRQNMNSKLYMAWLETLTSDLPSLVLLRGNQSSVITFYS